MWILPPLHVTYPKGNSRWKKSPTKWERGFESHCSWQRTRHNSSHSERQETASVSLAKYCHQRTLANGWSAAKRHGSDLMANSNPMLTPHTPPPPPLWCCASRYCTHRHFCINKSMFVKLFQLKLIQHWTVQRSCCYLFCWYTPI